MGTLADDFSLGSLRQGLPRSKNSTPKVTIIQEEKARCLNAEAGSCLSAGPNSPHTLSRSLFGEQWRLLLGLIIFLWIFMIGNNSIDYFPPWVEEPACRYLLLCHDSLDLPQETWRDVGPSTEDLANDTLVMRDVPQYVLDYAPLVHLFSDEQFWPCNMAEHLLHVTPEFDYTPVEGRLQNPNLKNLDDLNEYEEGKHVYLTSNDNVEDRPKWLGGEKNIPAKSEHGDDERTQRKPPSFSGKARSRQVGGRSNAPAVLVVINKGSGVVDAFWFYFYSYNLGNIVLNIRWGNHVGDWEHSMIRFQHGKPKAVYFSEHNFGSSYIYDAVEKIGKRPVVYSAVGTHAMYATSGPHPYILPLGLLHDATDRGPLWDPTLNLQTYTYSPTHDALLPSLRTPKSPTNWFYFNGHWGDKFYPLSDGRQYGLVGEYHYVNGPLGPRFKNLGRRNVCGGRECETRTRLESSEEVRIAPGIGEGDHWPGKEGAMSPIGGD